MMNEMRRHAKLVGLGATIPTIAVVAHGCKEPTQVTVDVKTNVICAELRGVDVVAAADTRRAEERAALVPTGSTTGSPTRFAAGSTTACKEGPAPREVGTLVVTPSGASAAVVVIAAFGETKVADCVAPQLPPRCIIARRRFSFVENKRITMPILLDPDCAGIPCNESSTCVGKKCVDSAVECAGDECTQPGVSADGGIVEVDAFSPLVDGSGLPPEDSGTDGDASSPPVDSGPDGTIGTDGGGTGMCTNMGAGQCLPPMDAPGNKVPCAVMSPCCYEAGNFSCKDFSQCASLAACCRGAGDCGVGLVCCADTDQPGPKTRITCKNPQECAQTGGTRVCSAIDPDCTGSGPGGCDFNDPYWANPEYFRCS